MRFYTSDEETHPGESSPLLVSTQKGAASMKNQDTKKIRSGSKIATVTKAVGVILAVVAASWTLASFSTSGDDVSAMTPAEIVDMGGTSRSAAIAKALVELKKKMDGRVYIHQSIKAKHSHMSKKEFEEAAHTWRQDRLPPLAVIEARSERDVQQALPVLAELKKKHDFPFRVRSGGHNKAGFSTVEGGAVLSLSKMNAIDMGEDFHAALKRRNAALESGSADFDPSSDEYSALVTIHTGTRVGDFTRELQVGHNYSGVTGVCSGVAEGGFVMGGGFGFLSRKYGMGSDNVERMRVVLANGTAVDATEDENADLFWAMRGGGSGNFGVLTEMEYRVHPIEDSRFFVQLYVPMADVAEFLSAIGEMESNGSLSRSFLLMYDGYSDTQRDTDLKKENLGAKASDADTVEDANALALIGLMWLGDSPDSTEQGRRYIENSIEPLLSQDVRIEKAVFSSAIISLGPPDGWGKSVYSAQTWCGFLYPVNNTVDVWTEIHSKMANLFLECPDLLPDIELWGGAINDVAAEETGFAHRHMVYNVGILLMMNDIDMKDALAVAAAKERFDRQANLVTSVWPSIAKYLSGTYVNYPMSSLTEEEYPSAYWGDNVAHLSAIKRKYDPSHVFSYEQSIPMNV